MVYGSNVRHMGYGADYSALPIIEQATELQQIEQHFKLQAQDIIVAD